MGPIVVPIVPAAILFDLNIGDSKIRPSAESGYAACRGASDANVPEGNVGAGAGATVGKLFGMHSAMKGGIGTASLKIGKTGLVVGAIVAVNAVGDVLDSQDGQGFSPAPALLTANVFATAWPKPSADQKKRGDQARTRRSV